MRVLLVVALALIVLPLAAAEPDVRPLCDGEPIVDLRSCYHGVTIHTCGSDDRLYGAGCFVPA